VKDRVSRLVLGFYGSVEHAEEALAGIRKKHFRRSSAIRRSDDGRIEFLHRGISGINRLVVASAAALATVFILKGLHSDLRDLSIGALVGFGIPLLLTVWFGAGLPKKTLREWERFVLPGECLVIAQEAEDRITDVVAQFRITGVPSVFVIRPALHFGSLNATHVAPPEPLITASLQDYAAELAASHVSRFAKSRSLLPVLKESQEAIEQARADLVEAARLEYGVSHAAEWLLDNTYLIRSHIAEIRENLPNNHNKILPVIVGRSFPVQVRIFHVAADLIGRSSYRVTAENIVSYLTAYQNETPLTIAELWVFPLMLRLVLLRNIQRLSESASVREHEKEMAGFWANRILNAVQYGPGNLQRIIDELDRGTDELRPHFVARLVEQLHKEESALGTVQKWVEAKAGSPLADIILRDHAEEANDVLLISTAIGSLRQLSELQYPKVVEAVSRIESILREDPSGVYARSDFATRDRCRRVVEASARQSKTAEWDVARIAVQFAQGHALETREGSVAFYLIDEGLPLLEKRIKRRLPWRERRLRLLYRHPTLIYLGSIAALTTVIVAALLFGTERAGVRSPLILLVLGLFAFFPVSELAVYSVQMWLALSIPPRLLPKMSFDDGIPDDCRTLVVIPMMLLTPDAIRGEIDKLEVRYLANPLPNLYFSLFADFTDAEDSEMPEDDDLLGVAIKGIEQLNARYPGGLFILFNRPRVWCETEKRWIGWERKRGKLEELNRLLNGEEDLQHLVQTGTRRSDIRYVITLDADTQLPHGSALKLIETIAHPLNRVELTQDERNRARGYTIIQPRVSITLPSATASRFSRLFTDARGTDPYCRAVSDLYQDVFGEAIYHGKGIYDVRAFHNVLTGRFPQQRLLSHDLIEGAHVGVGLATDIELFEQFPYDYTSHSKRQHRWIRGDWQIGSWILGKVPDATGLRRAPNPLSLINRWKIFDNLRRSLVAPGVLLLLIWSWSLNAAPLRASMLVAFVLIMPLLIQLLRRLADRWKGDVRALAEASSDLNRAIVMAAFLPHQAYLSMDAIARACYRLWVSRRNLLEWQTAEMSHLAARAHLDAYRAQFLAISILAGAFLLLLDLRGRFWEPAWAPFLLLWVGAPGVRHWIGWQRRAVRKSEEIDVEDERYLRRVARETWRYFDDLVGEEHNWLPPDNKQEALRIEIAARTSPTNIGMWLMSAVSAADLGFLTPDQMLDRCAATLETLQKLERYDGQLLNWYDTKTLTPLQPSYISTVDNGNLIASLWVLAQTCHELKEYRPIESRVARGLADTLAVLIARFPPDHTSAIPLETLRGLFQKESSGIEVRERIRLAADPARKLLESLRWSTLETEERTYWFRALHEQIQTWVNYFERHLRFADVLAAPPDDFLLPLGDDFIKRRRKFLRELPSLGELATEEASQVLLIAPEGDRKQPLPPKLDAWVTELQSELRKAGETSQSFLARATRLAELSQELARVDGYGSSV
jgi:cyclic beta-1,2-glucan synthetase